MPETTTAIGNNWSEENAPALPPTTPQVDSGNPEPPKQSNYDSAIAQLSDAVKKADDAIKRADNAATNAVKKADLASAKVNLIHKLVVVGLIGIVFTFIGFLMTFASFLKDLWNDGEKYEALKEENIELKESIQALSFELDELKTENSNILNGYTEDNTVKENMEAILKTVIQLNND